MSSHTDRVLSDNVSEAVEVQKAGNQTTLFQVPFSPQQWDFSRRWDIYNGDWKWDRNHVHMPCSPQSLSNRFMRWKIIEDILENVVRRNYDLESAIKQYNQKYTSLWSFTGLQQFRRTNQDTYNRVVPKIISMALSLPRVVTRPIPLLRQGREMTLNLSQVQIAAILANAFLCTFPWRNDTRKSDEYRLFPTINFSRLFADNSPSSVEKIKSLFHYFERVHDSPPTGVVTFTRRHIAHQALPDWSNSAELLPPLNITSIGSMETEGMGMLQVDFANKLVGGGVLGRGCVQEEIRFTTNPELIAARLFTEEFLDNEALLIVGSECYSQHSGYAASFKWAGDLIDVTERDRSGRRRCAIIAMDAVEYKDKQHQYEPSEITRELNKAFVGFHNQQVQSDRTPGVATGNWGCGAFNGDPELKSLIQLMSAAQAQRPYVSYFTFGDRKLESDVKNLHKFLSDNQITVGRLFNMLSCYNYRVDGSVIGFIWSQLQSDPALRNLLQPPQHHGDNAHAHGTAGSQDNGHQVKENKNPNERVDFATTIKSDPRNSNQTGDTKQDQNPETQADPADQNPETQADPADQNPETQADPAVPVALSSTNMYPNLPMANSPKDDNHNPRQSLPNCSLSSSDPHATSNPPNNTRSTLRLVIHVPQGSPAASNLESINQSAQDSLPERMAPSVVKPSSVAPVIVRELKPTVPQNQQGNSFQQRSVTDASRPGHATDTEARLQELTASKANNSANRKYGSHAAPFATDHNDPRPVVNRATKPNDVRP